MNKLPPSSQFRTVVFGSDGLQVALTRASLSSRRVNEILKFFMTLTMGSFMLASQHANSQTTVSPAARFRDAPLGRVDVDRLIISPSNVAAGQRFTVTFTLREFQNTAKTLEHVELWIQEATGRDVTMVKRWSDLAFEPGEQRSFAADAMLDASAVPGNYRAVVRGKVANDRPFEFRVVIGSAAAHPKPFSVFPSGWIDISEGVIVGPSPVTLGENFTVAFTLREHQGGAKILEYVEVSMQDDTGNDVQMVKRWSDVSFLPREERSFSANGVLTVGNLGRGSYRAVVRGKLANDSPFVFGVLNQSASNPQSFSAIPAGQLRSR